MSRRTGLYVVLLVCLVEPAAGAAVHYVRAGASGSTNGSDWVNAWTALPAALVRGDTYYIADGSYSNYDFNDAASGSTVITIKKATEADHGTDSGWHDSYGDGVATFSQLYFYTSSYVVDGATGSGTSGHGFEVLNTAGPDTNLSLVKLDSNVTDITLKRADIHRPREDYKGSCFTATGGGCRRITLAQCYLHDVFGVHIYFLNLDGATIERCVLARNKSTAEWHSESIQARATKNMIVRYCWFEDIAGTGVIISGSGDSSFWDIHGTVFFATPGFNEGNGHGTVADNFLGSIHDVRVHNNTFVGITAAKAGVRFWNSTGNCYAYNNLYVDCAGVGYAGTTHDYNVYYGCEFTGLEYRQQPNDVITTGDPFVDVVSQDVHLNSATPPGRTDVGSPFTVDPDGRTRGADGLWDRGAYEYSGGGTTRPGPPLRVRVND